MGIEKERRSTRSTSSDTKSQIRILLLFQLFCQGMREDSLREREKDVGRNKTPIDLLSCSQCCKPSSGTSSTEARGESPGRQKERAWLVSKKHFLLIMHQADREA